MVLSKVIPSAVRQTLVRKFQRTVYSAVRPYEVSIVSEPPFQGKTGLVTGGSGAIGRAICFKLASMGTKVYVGSRSKISAMKVVEEIRQAGFSAEPFVIDVTDEDIVEASFETFRKGENRLDFFVNCAGGGSRNAMAPLAEQSIETIDEVMNANLRGAVLCTRKAAQIMVGQSNGRIVIISSAVGIQGKARYSEYAAAKAGMLGFVRSMALELGPNNINVNCVSPGYIQRGEYDDRQQEYLKKTNALHKVGTPEDIACAVAFMVSDEAGFITGQNLVVDGGRTLGLMGD